MASPFRARRTPSEEPVGTGGKMPRARRAAARDFAASPYSRPPARSPPVASAQPQAQSPRWFSGLLSGAGKLISSVFRSPSSPSCSSSEDDYSTDEEDAICLSPKEQNEHDQKEKRSECTRECMEGLLAIVPKNESKLVIEQLLNQETFSRDESDKLIKLIQSRVVDTLSAEDGDDGIKDFPNRNIHTAAANSGARESMNLIRTPRDRLRYYSSDLDARPSGSSSFQIYTPDLCNTAVKEAKKWLEEKKLASSSKSDPECGPCTLNTDMYNYDMSPEVGSPVDMAKSYMQSLPPWRSPLLSAVGFRTPPAGGLRLSKDESPYSATHHSLLSSKVLKRNYRAIESRDAFDDIRRVRTKLTDDTTGLTNVKQIDSVARSSEHGASKSSSVALDRDVEVPKVKTNLTDDTTGLTNLKQVVARSSEHGASKFSSVALDRDVESLHSNHDLSSFAATENVNASTNLSVEVGSKDECSYQAPRLPEKEVFAADNPVKKGKSASNDLVSDPKRDVNVTNETPEISKLTYYSRKSTYSEARNEPGSETHSVSGNESKSPSEFEDRNEQRSSDCGIYHESDVEEPAQSKEQVGNIPLHVLPLSVNGESSDGANLIPTKHMKLNILSDHDDAPHLKNVEEPASTTGELHSFGDGTLHNGNAELHRANGSTDISTANGEEGHSNAINFVSGESSVGVSEKKLDMEGTNSIADQSANDMRMKSIERMLAEAQPNKGRKVRKAVGKSMRGRGRGRGR